MSLSNGNFCRFGHLDDSELPGSKTRYLPARRCQRVAFNIFLCFFLRMRLRRFLISEPIAAS